MLLKRLENVKQEMERMQINIQSESDIRWEDIM